MTVVQELKIIQKQNRGILRPLQIVEFAKDPNTALHSRFEWDDSKAGHEYRLWQAREIIRVRVKMFKQNDEMTTIRVRELVSLPKDRKTPGGGYRSIDDVMKKPHLRNQLLDSAFQDMNRFEEKYRLLSELTEVFEAFEKAKKAKKQRRN